MPIAIPAGMSPATGKARHWVATRGQKWEGEDSPLRCLGTCFACRSGWQLDPQKQRRKGRAQRSKVAKSQPASGKGPNQVHTVCRFTLDKLRMEWERRGKGSLPSQAWTVQPVGPQTCRPQEGAALARDLQLSEDY